MDGRREGGKEGRKDGRMDGRTAGRKEGRKDGWKEGRTDYRDDAEESRHGSEVEVGGRAGEQLDDRRTHAPDVRGLRARSSVMPE
eukprot:871048-Rhodomonas_salina.1